MITDDNCGFIMCIFAARAESILESFCSRREDVFCPHGNMFVKLAHERQYKTAC